MTYQGRGELKAGLADFAAAQPDFQAAVADFDAIKPLETHLSPHRKGHLWLDAGNVYAYVAQDPDSLSKALKLVDKAENMRGQESDDLILPSRFDQAGILIGRGMVHFVSPLQTLRAPARARKEFEQAMQLTPAANKRRHLDGTVRQAEAYLVEGAYEMAVTYAEQTLELVKDTDVVQDVTRLNHIYKRLKESSFGKSTEVADFGVKLFKMQHLEIFA